MTQLSRARKALAERFDEELRFFKGWMDKPMAVGALIPTSAVTCRRMASVIRPESGLPVLELGAGTGVVTRAILERGVQPENLYSIEFAPAFAERLRQDYPDVNVIEGDAFDLDKTLGEARALTFDCVVSAVPLLSFPVERRIAYVNDLLARIPAGRPVVQITYGPLSPVPSGRGDYLVEHFEFVLRNLPPAQLWLYRRPLSA